ncbi:hypothetical protein HZH66_002184 [Vespula vulgaris]|uniref:Uncharacterized protein n=1 Tax=Vespula vulgaris TaxID=7454 RepID=A0A834KJF3_VESVU|nr:hypothetical protein HZH66_002184 [Vespula vulgaris]
MLMRIVSRASSTFLHPPGAIFVLMFDELRHKYDGGNLRWQRYTRNELTRRKKKDDKENVDNEYRSVSRPENRNDMDRRIDVIKATNSGVPAGSLAPDVPSVSYRAVIALLDGSVQARRKDALRTIRKEAAQREGGSLGELE